ncbi:MAG: hypothetical protein ABI423_05965 [Burkholderiales bacterium]
MATRVVGDRLQRPLSMRPTAERLAEGLRFSADMAALGHASTFIPKGIYRFRTQAEAEEQRIASLARGIAARAAAARGTKR